MKAVIRTSDLKRLVRATKHFISKDYNRPLLNFIRLDFDFEDKTVNAVALDGFKLSIEASDLKAIDESFSAYIRPYLPVGIKNDVVTIEIIGNKCYIDSGDSSVGYEQPNGKKFNAKSVLEDLHTKPITCEMFVKGDHLVDALKSIQPDAGLSSVRIEYRADNEAILLKTDKSTRLVKTVRR